MPVDTVNLIRERVLGKKWIASKQQFVQWKPIINTHRPMRPKYPKYLFASYANKVT